MTIYFCIGNILDGLEKSDTTLSVLTDVTSTAPQCGGFPEDAFALADRPSLLDLDGEQALQQLTLLLEHVPLYHFNMELVLDEALSQRDSNDILHAALKKSFAGNILPNTLQERGRDDEGLNGSLRHPMLEHIDRAALCGIYLSLLRNLPTERQNYNFEDNILRKHESQFLEYFDGYIQGGHGRVKASVLIAFGLRLDHDPSRPMENFVAGGHYRALKMNIQDPHEMLWAWLEADDYQRRRCRDIHRVKLLSNLPRSPAWIRADIFALLEKEAMKQNFSEDMVLANPALTLLERLPHLKKAVQTNAEGQVDDLLQQLLSQTLNVDAPYSGAAGKFAETAEKRKNEARQARLI